MQRGFWNDLNSILEDILMVLQIFTQKKEPPTPEPTVEKPTPEEPESPSISQRYIAKILKNNEIPDPRQGVEPVNVWLRTNNRHALLQQHDRGYHQYTLFVGPSMTVLLP